jgi:hypothetical protein
MKRIWKTGARFDPILYVYFPYIETSLIVSVQVGEEGELPFLIPIHALLRQNWIQCTFFTRGSMTFKEAYLRTGICKDTYAHSLLTRS